VIPNLGLVLGIIGLIIANRSIREIESANKDGRGLAIAGKVCSIVGIVIQLIFILLLFFSFAAYTTFTKVV